VPATRLDRHRHGLSVYEIKILAADQAVHKLYLDAATGDLIKRKAK
jgi:uncharacterized membrane protein YkoI